MCKINSTELFRQKLRIFKKGDKCVDLGRSVKGHKCIDFGEQCEICNC